MFAHLRPRRWNQDQAQGVFAALLSAGTLGLAPIFGKQAMLAGAPPLAVVTLRTVFAMVSLWALFLLLGRRHVYIYPVGLLGCLAAGIVNGLGSLMYYTGLGRLDASLAQLLYALYPVFLTLFSRLDGQRISTFTALRMLLALAAVYLLTRHGQTAPDRLGAALMLGAGMLYAFHLVISQRVLYDVPAPTVALYNLTGMAIAVSIGYSLAGAPASPPSAAAWQAVLLLTLVTLVSRVSLFTGVKRLGGVQTALIGLSELLVTVVAALLWLGETLSESQWLGAGLLAASVLLVTREKSLGSGLAPRPWTLLVSGRSSRRSKPLAPPAVALPPAAPSDDRRLGE